MAAGFCHGCTTKVNPGSNSGRLDRPLGGAGRRRRGLTRPLGSRHRLPVRDHTPSRTAAWVATCRGLSGVLPPGEELCSDPYGIRFGGAAAAGFAALARRQPEVAWALLRRLNLAALSLYWVQLRTRALDDALLRFVRGGGRQVVVLGAGYDCRAARLASDLGEARVWEVDHPATQRRKRRILRGVDARTRYLPWDFEVDPMTRLAARLAGLGHDAGAPTFTLWEGVTMYLTEEAVAASVEAARALSAPGSPLVLEYWERASVERQPALEQALLRLGVQRHEPFRFGWHPAELAPWLARHGFALAGDEAEDAVAARYLSPAGRARFLALRGRWRFHLASAIRGAG